MPANSVRLRSAFSSNPSCRKNIFSGYLHFSKFSLDCLPSLAREQPDVPILDTHLNSERLIELPLRLFEANNRAVENRKVRSYLFGQKAV